MSVREADSKQYPYLECPKDGKEFRRRLSAAEVEDVARGDDHVGVATTNKDHPSVKTHGGQISLTFRYDSGSRTTDRDPSH